MANHLLWLTARLTVSSKVGSYKNVPEAQTVTGNISFMIAAHIHFLCNISWWLPHST